MWIIHASNDVKYIKRDDGTIVERVYTRIPGPVQWWGWIEQEPSNAAMINEFTRNPTRYKGVEVTASELDMMECQLIGTPGHAGCGYCHQDFRVPSSRCMHERCRRQYTYRHEYEGG